MRQTHLEAIVLTSAVGAMPCVAPVDSRYCQIEGLQHTHSRPAKKKTSQICLVNGHSEDRQKEKSDKTLAKSGVLQDNIIT